MVLVISGVYCILIILTETRKYGLEIVTGQESETSNGGKVHVTLYGEKGKSEQITLYATDPNNKTFEPGNIDQFQVSLYKIMLIIQTRAKFSSISTYFSMHTQNHSFKSCT